MLLCVMLTSGLLCLGDLHFAIHHSQAVNAAMCDRHQHCILLNASMRAQQQHQCTRDRSEHMYDPKNSCLPCLMVMLHKRRAFCAPAAVWLTNRRRQHAFPAKNGPEYCSNYFSSPVVGQLVTVSIRQVHVLSVHGGSRVSGGTGSLPERGIPAHVVTRLAVALLPLHLLLPQHQDVQATVMMDLTSHLQVTATLTCCTIALQCYIIMLHKSMLSRAAFMRHAPRLIQMAKQLWRRGGEGGTC